MSQKVRDIVIDKVLEALTSGHIPWTKPWGEMSARNILSGNPYRGINALLLNSGVATYYATYNQGKAVGLTLRKGSKSEIVTFYGNAKKKVNADGTERKGFGFLKFYKVFAIADFEGTLPKAWQTRLDALNVERGGEQRLAGEEQAQALVDATKAEIRETPNAHWHSKDDYIGMPPRARFDSPENYFSTLFHEM